jgi:DNA-binding response OmpR family regulator
MPRKILVIEDNDDLAHLLKIHLQDLSYEVELVFDGDTGLANRNVNRKMTPCDNPILTPL